MEDNHKTNLEIAIKQLSDVIDAGIHEAGEYHLFLVQDGRLTIIESIINGKPFDNELAPITNDLIRNTSKDAATMHAILVAEYTRYGPGGQYPNWHSNVWLVKTVDIASFTFPNLKAPGAGVR